MYRVYGGGQYVGDEAAEWFSSYLKRPGCKLYKLSQPKLIYEDEKWGDVALPGDKVILTLCVMLCPKFKIRWS